MKSAPTAIDRPVLLEIEGLSTHFEIEGRVAKAVDGVSLSIREDEVFGLVGESGCGKSVTALSILRLIPSPPGTIASGSIRFRGRDLLKLPLPEMRRIRGNRIAMIFQEPMTALDPVFTVGSQLREAIVTHQSELDRRQAGARAEELLRRVGIPDPQRRLSSYPHELSGGMRQRVMIAMALAMEPDLLIADEPTTALDVTIQAQILELMLEVRRRGEHGGPRGAPVGASILLITHDLAVVAETCDRVAVMYGGEIQEIADTRALFRRPLHPYTQGLLASLPRPDRPRRRLQAIPGTVPSILELPVGCRFTTRCPARIERCEHQDPELREVEPGHWCRCHVTAERLAAGQPPPRAFAWDADEEPEAAATGRPQAEADPP